MNGAIFIDASPEMQALLDELGPDSTSGLRVHRGDPDPAKLCEIIGNATAVLNGHTIMDSTLLQDLPKLKRIVFLGSGPGSYVDLKAAAEEGIEVRRVTGYGDITIAEHALALMFALARNIASDDAALRRGNWRPRPGIQLAGSTLGVVGAGGVGRQMIRLGAAIGMEVLVAARRPPEADLPAQHVPLDELLAQSDVVSLHLAQTPETTHIIGMNELLAMKPGALLINSARGALIDESALVSALQAGHLGGVGLDVFEDEPLSEGAAILNAPRTVLTPHTAYNTPQAARTLLEHGLRLLKE
jgi:D-3-phosphoglycerate dehydrogenase